MQRLRNFAIKNRKGSRRARENGGSRSCCLERGSPAKSASAEENSIENSPREVPRRRAWSVGEPVAMAEWPENKMNETDRRAEAVVKYAGEDRPGERGSGRRGGFKKGRWSGTPKRLGRWPVDSEKFDIHSFLVTARKNAPRGLFPLRRVSNALVRFIPFYNNRSGFLSFLSRWTDHRHRPPTRFVRDCDREVPVRTCRRIRN